MNKELIEFCFKGNRNYVHGTDIFNKIVKFLIQGKLGINSINNLNFSIHRQINNNINFILTNNKQIFYDDFDILFSFKTANGNEFSIYGFESNIPINCRYEYDEDKIYKFSEIDLEEKTIILNKNTGYTFIENIVAMNKFLLTKVFETENIGKWFFVRLELNNFHMNNIRDFHPIKLQVKTNLGLRMIKSYIKSGNIEGYIYFSLKKFGK